MRKFSPVLLRVSALLLATLLLVSCKKDPNAPDSNDPSQSENITDITPVTDAPPLSLPDADRLATWDEPYRFCYSSNGDGTCKIVDVIIHYRQSENVTLVIPECAPNGDRVTEIAPFIPSAYTNLPKYLLPEDYNALLERLKTYGYSDDNSDLNKYISYATIRDLYVLKEVKQAKTEKEKRENEELLKEYPIAELTPVYVRETDYRDETMNAISKVFRHYGGFTEQQCLQSYQKLCRLIEQSTALSADKKYTLQNSLKLPYHPESIVAIELPGSVKSLEPYTIYTLTSLKSIRIGAEVKAIQPDALLTKLGGNLTVEFGGTTESWKKLYPATYNLLVHCSNGDVEPKEQETDPYQTPRKKN